MRHSLMTEQFQNQLELVDNGCYPRCVCLPTWDPDLVLLCGGFRQHNCWQKKLATIYITKVGCYCLLQC